MAPMPTRRILVVIVSFALVLGALFALEAKSAEPCSGCAVGLDDGGHCSGASDMTPCQPCLGGCPANLAIGAGLGQVFVAADARPAAHSRLASLASKPSQAPPRV
jgi:hypothetical protein